tara:strand:+ start:141 stop:347 length:207 start_codon:yes stop_codon:yes gene_type:complete
MKMKLYIANERGHTEMIVNATSVIEQITDHPTHWVFVDGDMIMRENIPEVNWEEVTEVRLQEAVIGGF